MGTYQISEVAERTGFSSATLRYYEKIGLVDPADRAGNGYRVYDDRSLARLSFIARAKQLGLALNEISELAGLWDDDRCGPVQERLRHLVDEKRADAQRKIVELISFTAELDGVAGRLGQHTPDGPCDDACGCVTEPADVTVEPSPKPDIACTLAPDQMGDRLSEWRAVLDEVVGRTAVGGGVRLEFPARPGLAAKVADLATREQQCCAFFEFVVHVSPAGLALEVRAPEAAVELVAGLFGAPS